MGVALLTRFEKTAQLVYEAFAEVREKPEKRFEAFTKLFRHEEKPDQTDGQKERLKADRGNAALVANQLLRNTILDEWDARYLGKVESGGMV